MGYWEGKRKGEELRRGLLIELKAREEKTKGVQLYIVFGVLIGVRSGRSGLVLMDSGSRFIAFSFVIFIYQPEKYMIYRC